MSSLENLILQNKNWAKTMTEKDPDFFGKLSELQKPEYLWIGCSDSRLTPVSSVGLLPGEMFVHRNIANLVIHTDMNCLSVMQFAVEVLKVKHIIVCGHYGCGGVIAAFQKMRLGLIDNWLRHIEDVAYKHSALLSEFETDAQRIDKLCELNIIEQVDNVAETTVVRDAWANEQDLTVHGWIYRIGDGIYRDLDVSLKSLEDMENLRRRLSGENKETAIGL